MLSVFDIAGWFISKEKMTHQKLQCLVYLSYAWFYALNHQDLFETDGFEVNPIFPCEMQLFLRFHYYGNKKISKISFHQLDDEIVSFLDSVYDTYAFASQDALCGYLRMSMPYQNARQNQCKIQREDMRAFYESQQQH